MSKILKARTHRGKAVEVSEKKEFGKSNVQLLSCPGELFELG